MRFFRRDMGDKFSEGARLLWLAMLSSGVRQAEFAARAGTDRAVFSHWLYGTRRPSWPSRMVLRKKLRIPLNAWDQPPTQEFILPAAAADRPSRTGTDG